MNVYVDSSVLLRIAFGEPGRLKQWSQIEKPFSSALIRLECLRTVDRTRIRLGLPDHDVVELRVSLLRRLDAFHTIELDTNVLERASQPLPVALGSLDAIHLATALLLRASAPTLAFATHDKQLASAARACGFNVLGS